MSRQAPDRRITLGGGDADTDVTFVGDATGAHLVLNRNKNEVMCRAYDYADGRWVVNPMFIEPLPRRTTAYPCATAAYTEPDGGFGPRAAWRRQCRTGPAGHGVLTARRPGVPGRRAVRNPRRGN